MKNLFKYLAVFGLIITCFGCTTNKEDDNQTANLEEPVSDEVQEVSFDDINEFEQVNGAYQIHSIEGIKNMANHLDAAFNLLCDIDLGGATIEPLGSESNPFTGLITGHEFKIKNFKIDKSVDGNLGFFGVFNGTLNQVGFEDATLVADSNTKNIGVVAGVNNGSLYRVDAIGNIDYNNISDNANIGGLVGLNTSDIRNSNSDVDFTISSNKTLNIGGLVGSGSGGRVRDSITNGYFELKADNANIGLLVGEINDSDVARCTFMGEKNKVNDELYTTLVATKNNTETSELLIRDNSVPELDPKIKELRDKVVQYMYDAGTFEWSTPVLIATECVAGCNANVCHVALVPGKLYHGLPYKHSLSTLDRMEYIVDENHQLKDWIVEQGPLGGFQTYIGSDCYRSVQLSWSTVANSMNSANCMESIMYPEITGVVHIGNWSNTWDPITRLNDAYTAKCITLCGEQAILEDYALMHAGDALVYINSGGAHCIMCCEEPVIVRDEKGNIDPNHSYIYFHDQGSALSDCEEFSSTWSIHEYRTFQELLAQAFLPISIKELQTGICEPIEVHIEKDADGILGLTTGIIKSNYYVDSVTMVITDEKGNEVFNKKMFSRMDKVTDYDGNVSMFERTFVNEFDLADFITPLEEVHLKQGAGWHCKLSTKLNTGDEFVVKEFDF